MSTVRIIAIDVAYHGISPGIVAADAAAETLGSVFSYLSLFNGWNKVFPSY